MPFLLVIALLGALAWAETAPLVPLAHPLLHLAVGALALLVAPLFAAVISASTAASVRHALGSRRETLARFDRLRRWQNALWLAMVVAVSGPLSWGTLIRVNFGLAEAWVIDELLVTLPVWLPLILTWAAYYEVDRALRQVYARLSGEPPELWPRRRYVLFQMRQQLSLLAVPVLAILALEDTLRLFAAGWLEGPFGQVLSVLPAAIVLLLFPEFLRRTWRAKPLPPGPLRTRLEAALVRQRVRVRDIVVWETNGSLINAATAGFFPWCRYVYLSDGLVARLDDDEIEAVFGHELGHLCEHHLALRALVGLAPVLLWLTVGQWLVSPADIAASGVSIGANLLPSGEVPGGWTTVGAALVLAAAYVRLIFGAFSRRLERRADLFGCRVAAAGAGQSLPYGVAAFISALEKLAAANGGRRNTHDWQHGSIAQRIDFLQSVLPALQPAALPKRQQLVESVV